VAIADGALDGQQLGYGLVAGDRLQPQDVCLAQGAWTSSVDLAPTALYHRTKLPAWSRLSPTRGTDSTAVVGSKAARQQPVHAASTLRLCWCPFGQAIAHRKLTRIVGTDVWTGPPWPRRPHGEPERARLQREERHRPAARGSLDRALAFILVPILLNPHS
jgi:hypothetical protein